jgi:hypothetical protein
MTYSFFQKADPRITVWLGNGRGIKFVDIGNGIGLYSTNVPDEVAEIRSLIQRGVGAITELSYTEYLEVKKNRSSTKQRWREEVDNKELARRAHQRQTDPAKNAPPAASSEPAPPVVPMPEPGARPKVRSKTAPPPPPRQ